MSGLVEYDNSEEEIEDEGDEEAPAPSPDMVNFTSHSVSHGRVLIA